MSHSGEQRPTDAIRVLGHPRGLFTLFFTEMWERFSYYGMKALLYLFLIGAVQQGGFGLTDRTAAAIYGLYTSGVYLVALPGGWIADRLIGGQRAIWWGGIVIMLGHLMLAAATGPSLFYLGLLTIVLGTGLLKPNVSALVADLYPSGGGRRDAGYSVYYLGINLGGFLGPLVTGWLAVTYGWSIGFLSAAIGMAFGLLQFQLTKRHLHGLGLQPHDEAGSDTPARRQKRWNYLLVCVAVLGVIVALIFSGVLPFNPLSVARNTSAFIFMAAIACFVYLLFFAGLSSVERGRIIVVIALFVTSALFWAGFEQTGSSMNLFADRYTDRMLTSWHFEIPTSWFQSIESIFIIIFAPMFAALWLALAKRNRELSSPANMALGLLLMGAGFVVMAGAAHIVAGGLKVLPIWLVVTYLLHAFGELFLSPVGMSSFTKLVPPRFAGQIMGLWFLSMSLGNLVAGLIAGEFDAENIPAMSGQYMNIVWFVVIPGVLLLLLVKPLKKLAAGVK